MTLTATPTRHVAFRSWRGADGFGQGSRQGSTVEDDLLTFGTAAGTLTYADPYADEPSTPVTYEWAAWVSPEVETGFAATEVVPSWNASTPEDSWLLVEARTATPDGDDGQGRRWSRWFTLARWADSDREIHPTSVPGQDDLATRVQTDVLAAGDGLAWAAHQVRVSLVRRVGSTARPTVRMVGAMASQVPGEPPDEVSPGGAAWGVELPVPPYSQQLHRGEYLHWDRGGRSWCSPTSMSMLLAFHGRLPSPDDYAWVEPGFPDRFIVQAARHVFDYAYKGAGNWAFNTAYAGRYGAESFVTRLRSLTEAEAVHRRGPAARGDRVLHREEPDRGRLRHRRPPADDRRVHRDRRRDLQRPGLAQHRQQRRGAGGLRPPGVRAGVARGVGRRGVRRPPGRRTPAAARPHRAELVTRGPAQTSAPSSSSSCWASMRTSSM